MEVPVRHIEALTGAWSLVSFEIQSADGSKRPWRAASSGLLLYLPTGHMSVSINGDLAAVAIADEILESILFYSGTFEVADGTIVHFVKNATDPARIGRRLIRYAFREGDILRLESPRETFGKAILKWKRAVNSSE